LYSDEVMEAWIQQKARKKERRKEEKIIINKLTKRIEEE
jgi:hypothetical protein